MKKEQLTEQELELIRGIIEHNRDYPPVSIPSQCSGCIHWYVPKNLAKCKKRPKGIPREIWTEEEICKDFQEK